MKNIIISLGIFLILGLTVLAVYASKLIKEPIPVQPSPSPTETLLGGDKDEHGCVPSAGYSWCEPKQKCLRVWEEKCFQDAKEEIQYILANKYQKSPSVVKISMIKETDSYAGGSVMFGGGGPGESGLFLAKKTDNVWEVVFDGNGNVDCDKMRKVYEFPDEVLVPNFCE